MSAKPDTDRRDYYQRIGAMHMTPLWEVLRGLITPSPRSACQPAIWHYEAIRPFILESGRLISAQEAVRRVLILENPGLPGESKITTSLYAGLQLILPGEIAPAHRHSQTALRFIVEGEGAYTAVEGEKTIMREGDFVITPSWAWHDHGNESDQPMVWLDGLDIPIIQFFDASFAEDLDSDAQTLTRPEGDALARYGSGLLPVDYHPSAPTSPVFNYPYARTREALEQLRRQQEWDACFGLKLRYVNPANGGYAIPTMGTFMQLLPKDFSSDWYRCTDATVYSVVEGRGTVEVDGQALHWSQRDTFVIPSWRAHRFMAEQDAVLFSFSDRPIQQTLGIWRERRGGL